MPESVGTPPVTTCAIIPVYNHPTTIGSVVAGLRHYDLPIILVDDGSDATCATTLADLAANDTNVSLLRLRRNAGKGAAVTAGAREAMARGYSHILQIDADGQHDTEAVPGALREAHRHPDAMIIGVPVFDESIPRARLYGRWLSHVLVWTQTWSLAIRDAMCGFRIYPLSAYVALASRHHIGRRMDFDIDIAVRLVWNRVPVRRVPVAVRYPADGISHFNMWRDNARITALHIRLLAGMLIRSPRLAHRRLSTLLGR